MSHLPWKPIRLRNLEQEIDQAFDELIHGQWGLCPPSGNWQPEIDIFETLDYYLVEADVPGVDPDEIHVTVDPHSLTISGWRRSGCVEHSAQGVCIERRQGSFVRRIPLDQAIDPSHVKRENQAGILRLKIPKQKLSPPA
ncbi:Hsp20/alpha crystallin family protein [Gimesia sp.]|uniref:Hsp20/alpha crystallin family protein n=1 Tax=Gimesia sp. TaxID=2024833 RepID=UPI003A8F293E